MPAMDTTKIAQRIASIEIELARLPHGRATNQRREQLQGELNRLEDEREYGPVPSYAPGLDPLYEGLEDETDQAQPAAPKPAPAALRTPGARAHDGGFHPTPEDERARLEMAAGGLFRPAAPSTRPARPRSIWARRGW